MERMRLIALFGPKRSGKDEAARYLCDAWYATPPWGWRLPAWRAAFADPLRQACDALGLPSATTRGRKDEPCASLDGHPGRAVLVAIGEAVRALAPDYFARHAIERARDLGGLVVITDGRRVNEARAVCEAGGVCAWVHRPEAMARMSEDAVVEPAAHAFCHFEIRNTGDLDHLRAECRRLLDFALSMPEVTP
jgi:hypothetical protein